MPMHFKSRLPARTFSAVKVGLAPAHTNGRALPSCPCLSCQSLCMSLTTSLADKFNCASSTLAWRRGSGRFIRSRRSICHMAVGSVLGASGFRRPSRMTSPCITPYNARSSCISSIPFDVKVMSLIKTKESPDSTTYKSPMRPCPLTNLVAVTCASSTPNCMSTAEDN